jgi:hypothetical protein
MIGSSCMLGGKTKRRYWLTISFPLPEINFNTKEGYLMAIKD